MYETQKSVQILVGLMKAHGVRHVVLSPGSRNIALVRSLEGDPYFTCYSVVDERSAAYFAIGIYLERGEPVALSCTSAQATRNYIPGMTEAYYRGTPLLVITADYKPSHVGVGTMQAIQQMSIPKDAAKVSVQLPVVRDADDEWYCTRLVNEAILGLSHHGTGPAHINIPIEEHWDGGVQSLPPVRKIDRHAAGDDALPPIPGKKILVVVGEHAPFSPSQERALAAFAEAYGAVVYTNHLSNYHGAGAVPGGLAVLNVRAQEVEAFTPDVLITIGDQVGDYDSYGFLHSLKTQHWRVHLDGRLLDTYRSLTRVFEMSEDAFFTFYASRAPAEIDQTYRDVWDRAKSMSSIPANLPLSHALVADTLSPMLPAGSAVHFAILSAFRNWSFFELEPSIAAYANVAAFGIDGCLSTFIGHSVASDALTFLVIGDLSFFYDMNAIGNRHVKNNARIVLINNQGGGEFRLYSHAADQYFGDEANAHIAAAGHFGAARAWVEAMGWEYLEVRTKADLRDHAGRFVSPGDRPIVMEVFTSMKADSDGVRMIRRVNPPPTLGRLVRRLPQAAKQRLPRPVKRVAKQILGR